MNKMRTILTALALAFCMVFPATAAKSYGPIPGVELKLEYLCHWGHGAMIGFKLTNTSGQPLYITFYGTDTDAQWGQSAALTAAENQKYPCSVVRIGGHTGMDGLAYDEIAHGETHAGRFYLANVAWDTDSIGSFSLAGTYRISNSNENKGFAYTFRGKFPISYAQNTNLPNVTCTMPFTKVELLSATRNTQTNLVTLDLNVTNQEDEPMPYKMKRGAAEAKNGQQEAIMIVIDGKDASRNYVTDMKSGEARNVKISFKMPDAGVNRVLLELNNKYYVIISDPEIKDVTPKAPANRPAAATRKK